MRTVAVILALLVLIMPISGCFGDEPVQSPEPVGPFSTLGDIPETTWYHYSGGVNALDPVAVSDANISDYLSGDNMPFLTVGSYYGIGMSTFEPTIGITSVSYTHLTLPTKRIV